MTTQETTIGDLPGTRSTGQLNRLLENCTNTICWLCNTRNAVSKYSIPVLLLYGKNIGSSNYSSGNFHSSTTTLTWTDEKYILVPICKECNEASDSWKSSRSSNNIFMLIGLFFFVGLLVAAPAYARDFYTGQAWVIGTYCISAFGVMAAIGVIVQINEFQKEKNKYKTISIKEFPDISSLVNSGWVIQGKEDEGFIFYHKPEEQKIEKT
jgi:hypothetical protein